MERETERVLREHGVAFERADHFNGLDFFLPEFGIYIEVKRFHSHRIADQMSRVEDVIVIQGMGALRAFEHMLKMGPMARRLDAKEV